MVNTMLRRSGFFVGCVVGMLLVSGCQNKEVPYSDRSLYTIYTAGVDKLEKERFVQSADEFSQVEQQYPYSSWAPKAQLMAGYALYEGKKYTRAIGTFENFLYLHPYHPYADYAHYMVAMSYYQQMDNINRDTQSSEYALEAFTTVMNRYPTTAYGLDAKNKRAKAFNHMAAHYTATGRFYQQNKLFIAAIKSFQKVLNDFRGSRYEPEATYRILECSLSLGLPREAELAQKHLVRHFPQSVWCTRGKEVMATCQPPAA